LTPRLENSIRLGCGPEKQKEGRKERKRARSREKDRQGKETIDQDRIENFRMHCML